MAIWFKYSIKCKFNLKNDIKNMAWKVVRPQNLSDKILRTQPQVKRIRFFIIIYIHGLCSSYTLCNSN